MFELLNTRPEQVMIGGISTILCLAALWRSYWFYTETRKGRTFARAFGEQTGLWILRGLFVAGALLSAALATGLLNPLHT